jgi:hypothetical protein
MEPTYSTRINGDGFKSVGVVHPEIAEASLGCLKRDLKQLRHTKGKSFIRRPYTDLHEAELIALNAESPPASLIAGVAVFPLIIGDTNARVPMTAQQVQESIRKGDLVDCWTKKGFA